MRLILCACALFITALSANGKAESFEEAIAGMNARGAGFCTIFNQNFSCFLVERDNTEYLIVYKENRAWLVIRKKDMHVIWVAEDKAGTT